MHPPASGGRGEGPGHAIPVLSLLFCPQTIWRALWGVVPGFARQDWRGCGRPDGDVPRGTEGRKWRGLGRGGERRGRLAGEGSWTSRGFSWRSRWGPGTPHPGRVSEDLGRSALPLFAGWTFRRTKSRVILPQGARPGGSSARLVGRNPIRIPTGEVSGAAVRLPRPPAASCAQTVAPSRLGLRGHPVWALSGARRGLWSRWNSNRAPALSGRQAAHRLRTPTGMVDGESVSAPPPVARWRQSGVELEARRPYCGGGDQATARALDRDSPRAIDRGCQALRWLGVTSLE
jgi:hypothetical protein